MCDDMNTSFDVIVIGGGHAGCGPLSAAGLGADVALITMDKSRIGEMSATLPLVVLERHWFVKLMPWME